MIIAVAMATGLSSCKKEGCTDPNANNFDADAKKECCCTYPTINVNGATGDGDVTGAGGTASTSFTWDNSDIKAEYAMDITAASGGSMTLTIQDAAGTTVLNQTLTSGVGDDSASGCTATGVIGTWTITISLNNFGGDGSYSVDPGGTGC